MKKGFASIILTLALGIASVGGFIYYATHQPKQPARFGSQWFEEDQKLGASVTPVFPTSTNDFEEGEVIEEEDWNALEDAIGIRNSSDTASLSWQLRATTSSDPGHKHTTASVSGTIAVAQGGTGTSTLTSKNILIGSGTSSVAFLAPSSTAGVLVGSNGTDWVNYSLTAGTGVTLTTSTNSTQIAASPSNRISVITATSTVTAASTSTANLASITIPANTLSTSSAVEAAVYFSDIRASTTATGLHIIYSFGGTEIGATSLEPKFTSSTSPWSGMSTISIFGNASTSSQKGVVYDIFSTGMAVSGESASSSISHYTSKVLSIDSTANQNLLIQAKWDQINASSTISVDAVRVMKIQ